MIINVGGLSTVTGSDSYQKKKVSKAPQTFGDKVYRVATLPLVAAGGAVGAIAGAGFGAGVGGLAGGAAGMGLTSGLLYGDVDSRSVNNKVKSLKRVMKK